MFYPQDFELFILVFFAGSMEEREVYKKAKRRVPQHTDESVQPANLNLLIKHPNPVFGTDFDVIAEVYGDGILSFYVFHNLLVCLSKQWNICFAPR